MCSSTSVCAVQTSLIRGIARCSAGEVLIAVLTPAPEPSCTRSFGLVGEACLAALACDAIAWVRHHCGMELAGGLRLGADHAGDLSDLAKAVQAAPPGFSLLLLQLCRRKPLLDLLSPALGAPQLASGLEIALRLLALRITGHAGGRSIGSDALPLVIGEATRLLAFAALLAGRRGPSGLKVRDQVDLASELAEQQAGALGDAALEEPQREGPQNQDVLSAADAAGDHRAEGRVHPLAHVQVQQHGFPGHAGVRAAAGEAWSSEVFSFDVCEEDRLERGAASCLDCCAR